MRCQAQCPCLPLQRSLSVLRCMPVCRHQPPAQALPAGDHPAQSRAGPPVTVPDITGEEALRYLQLLGVTQPKQAQQVGRGRLRAWQKVARTARLAA